MRFADTQRIHAIREQEIVSILSTVDQLDENHCSSRSFVRASGGVNDLRNHFVHAYHLSKQDRNADEQSRETSLWFGNNTLHLMNPTILLNRYDDNSEKHNAYIVALKSDIPYKVHYIDMDIAETSRIGREDPYFGPHIIGILLLENTVSFSNVELEPGHHPIVVPFYAVEVAETQPIYNLN